MSTIKIVTMNREELPILLLPIAKSHMRIDTDTDDALIQSKIGIAISWFERKTGVTVNPTTYLWKPDAADFRTPRAGIDPAVVPFSPVNDGWTAAADPGAVDVTANYAITTAAFNGVFLYRLEGAFTAGLALTIASGYADETVIDPGILDAVLRYTAHLYEHREILLPDAEPVVPGFLTEAVSTYWVPRV